MGVSDFGRLNKKTDDTDRGGYSANHSAANYDRPTAQTTTQTTTETIYDSNNSGTNSVYNSTNEANRGLTAQDQGSSDMDIKTTQAIRQQVVAQDEFSSTAKNIKIITINGLVVLKGPVRTMAEKSKIEAIAMNVAGHTKVTNEITVSK